ncbi:MAG: hypothetical protein A2W99_16020 [Bacteroidetes bacterium GWF2_33_16]|nr:MAG: hypothetical protein A2X00_15365 [Bacteroidetes bacterium GWE2_32_14]OFY02408.1 MAG: hypothetical protein A2W99_16020 [Bacteroidetes bacterium GWF2_33_16]
MKKTLFLIISFIAINSYSQDTIRFEKLQSIGKTYVLISSIELYNDSSFTWTNEHDLSWSEYGLYEVNEDTLILNFYYHDLDDINKDSIDWVDIKKTKEIVKIRKYLMIENKMYEIKKNDRLERWTKDRTMFRDNWRWITFGYRKTYFIIDN